MNRAVIGAQYGDEGKGKIVDYLAKYADFAVRFNGSGNAGHCVEKDDGARHSVHLLPAAVYRKGVTCCTGAGMVINPITLYNEIKEVEQYSDNRIWVDPKAHVVTSYHIHQDQLDEDALGDDKIMTTLTGNGPAYVDKVSRRGIRLHHLLLPEDDIRHRLHKSKSFISNYLDDFALASSLHELGKRLSPHFRDLPTNLNRAIATGKSVLFCGAHGTFLDIDFGNYPFLTSSTCLVGGVGSTGVSPTHLDDVIGVVKAYTTRSGTGPMPEMPSNVADRIRTKANEFGTTTGRARRIGWIDLAMVRRASILNRFTGIAITMLDILTGFKRVTLADASSHHTLNGWTEDISKISHYEELPEEAKRFIELIERAAGVPAVLISVGPKRNQTIKTEIDSWPWER